MDAAYAITATSFLQINNDFEMREFMDEPIFDQFVDLIRGGGENQSSNSFAVGSNFGLLNNFGVYVDNHHHNHKGVASAIPGDVFDFNGPGIGAVQDTNFYFNAMQGFTGEMNGDEDDDEDDEDDEDSSGTTTTTTTSGTKKKKIDRSKTLISERKRRGRMKEKLYALRSLVPNITKMDKASIIGDAVSYVQDLQVQAQKLKTEIAGLEASLGGSERFQESTINAKSIQFTKIRQPVCKKIMQLEVFQFEERGFYIKLICKKGEGVAASLFKALESLHNFKIQNTNLATISDTYALTFNLNVRDSDQPMSIPNLRAWVMGAFINHGFEFKPQSLS